MRAVVYGVLARKVEGITWPIDWMQHWPEAAEISRKILPISPVLALSKKPREGVALLHSLDQHHRCVAENWTNGAFPDRPYEGKLMTAWWALMAAGHPANRVVEEELLADRAGGYRAIVAPGLTHVRPVVREALLRYIKAGGVVLLDADATLDLPGARKLGFAFANGFDPKIVPPSGTVAGANQRLAFDTLVVPHLPALRKALAEVAPPLVESDNPHLITGQMVGDEARYFWIVNNQTARDDKKQFVPEPIRAAIALPDAAGVLYDVFDRKQLAGRKVELDLAEGDAKLFARLPKAVADVTLDEVAWKPPYLTVRATVRDAEGGPLPVLVPVRVELFGTDGKVIWAGHRGTVKGVVEDRYPLGHALPPGTLRVRVTEYLSGKSAEKTVAVAEAAVAVGTGAAVERFDADRLATLLKPGRELLILVGQAEYHQTEAKRLAAAFEKLGVKAVIESADGYTGKDRLDDPRMKGQIFPYFNGVTNHAVGIHRDVVVLGGAADNSMMRKLVKSYDLTPWRLRDDDPGAGRAVVWWAAAAFGLEHRIAAVYATDALGLERGVTELLKGR